MADGCVGVVGDPQPHIPSSQLPIAQTFAVRPDTRLLPLEPNPSQRLVRLVPRATVTEVYAWTTTRLSHYQEQRDHDSRDPRYYRVVHLLAGPVIDTTVLFLWHSLRRPGC